MQVGLLVVGAFVVDDMGDIVNVDAACRDVGGDEDVDLAVAEGAQGLLAGTLAEIAVDGADGEAALGEVVADALGLALGAGEDHDELAAVGLEDSSDELDLVHGVGAPYMLLDGIDRGALVVGLGGANMHWLGHVAACEVDDLPRHRGREEHRLPDRRDLGDDPLDVGQEAHVEHLVGFVEHKDLYLRQVKVATVREVDDAAGRSDDDIDAVAQGVDLGFVGAAAVDGEHAHAAQASGPLEVGCDLESELAGRADDEGLGAIAVTLEVDPLEERNAEAEGLAGAGLGLSDEVLTLEGQRKAHLLDGKGALDAIGKECCGDLWIGAEFSKCRCCCRIDA
ncbi:unannotated protein [freshwater metagenome]|uniref:Unannotated protein n=1 Tax=freshwater metagenome TaxID=449393 RepID=A0A6J7LEG2_9ZZZZ